MRLIYFVSIVAFLFLQGCDENKKPQTHINDLAEEEVIEVNKESDHYVTVQLINNDNKKVGEAILEEGIEGVTISLKGENLPPGLHGYHIHEKGLCEGPTFETAGGHFNPDDKQHGFDHENGPHAGDLPNLNVGADGKVKNKYVNDRVTLRENKPHSLKGENGTSLIIHARPDDYISQPAGDAGERIACGVISEGQ